MKVETVTGGRLLVGCLLLVGCVLGFVVGKYAAPERADATQTPAAAVVGSADAEREFSVNTVWATSDFPVNEQGMTYGSDSEAVTPEQMPDLIAAQSDQGEIGFLLKTDVLEADGDPSLFDSPEEALAWQERQEGKPPAVIPVYALDGRTQIGTFTYATLDPDPTFPDIE